MKKAVQQIMLGTVTGNKQQAQITLKKIKDAGYDGIELNRFMIHPTSLLVQLLTKAAGMPSGKGGKLNWKELVEEAGLEVISLHVDLGSLEKETDSIIKEAREFNTDKIVITGMYRYDYSDENSVRELAERLNKAGKSLQEAGITLLYHNHNVELTNVNDSLKAYDILISHTDPQYVSFEFDSYWFTDGGADAGLWMKKLGNRMKLWHITDRGARINGPVMTPIVKCDSMELGTGNMDLAGLKEIAIENGIEAVILESHKNWIDKDPLKSLELSAEWLNENIQ